MKSTQSSVTAHYVLKTIVITSEQPNLETGLNVVYYDQLENELMLKIPYWQEILIN